MPHTKKALTLPLGVLVLSYLAFISLGLPDGLLGVAWPGMRGSFGQSLDALGLLLIAQVTGYTLSSFTSAWWAQRLGLGRLLSLSCALTALALAGYGLSPFWWLMLPFGVLSGLGAGAIDAGLNAWFEKHHGEGLMQWLHASFGVGITTGPLIMTAGIALSGSWRPGYLLSSGLQAALALAFFLFRHRWLPGPAPLATTTPPPASATSPVESAGPQAPAGLAQPGLQDSASLRQTLAQGRSWLSAFLFFVYVGVEVSMGHWAYSFLTEGRGIAAAPAGFWTGAYWASFTLGRILAGFVAHRVSSRRLVNAALVLALAGILLLLWNPALWVSLGGTALLGLALAPVFPALVSSTSQRVGRRFSSHTVGMQMSLAGLGAALLPALSGIILRHWGVAHLPWILLGLTLLLALMLLGAQRLSPRMSPGVDKISAGQ